MAARASSSSHSTDRSRCAGPASRDRKRIGIGTAIVVHVAAPLLHRRRPLRMLRHRHRRRIRATKVFPTPTYHEGTKGTKFIRIFNKTPRLPRLDKDAEPGELAEVSKSHSVMSTHAPSQDGLRVAAAATLDRCEFKRRLSSC